VINDSNIDNSGSSAASNFLDVNADSHVTPLDALLVINHLDIRSDDANSPPQATSSSGGPAIGAAVAEDLGLQGHPRVSLEGNLATSFYLEMGMDRAQFPGWTIASTSKPNAAVLNVITSRNFDNEFARDDLRGILQSARQSSHDDDCQPGIEEELLDVLAMDRLHG
jgi:hypothetical protein